MIINCNVKVSKDKKLPFVYATWLKSFHHSSPIAKRIRSQIFYSYHQETLTEILERDATKIYLAVAHDDDNVILGYLVTENDNIHFVYVKRDFRNFGVAKILAEAFGKDLNTVQFSHWTHDTDWICSKYPEMIYNPYLVRGEKWLAQVDQKKKHL